jgi:hypothetical protein
MESSKLVPSWSYLLVMIEIMHCAHGSVAATGHHSTWPTPASPGNHNPHGTGAEQAPNHSTSRGQRLGHSHSRLRWPLLCALGTHTSAGCPLLVTMVQLHKSVSLLSSKM